MYGIFTYIYHRDKPYVGKYSIHGSYVLCVIQTKIVHGLGKLGSYSIRSNPIPSMGVIYLPTFGWIFLVNDGK